MSTSYWWSWWNKKIKLLGLLGPITRRDGRDRGTQLPQFGCVLLNKQKIKAATAAAGAEQEKGMEMMRIRRRRRRMRKMLPFTQRIYRIEQIPLLLLVYNLLRRAPRQTPRRAPCPALPCRVFV